MPRVALGFGLLSLACSLSVVAFFVGVPLGLVAVLMGLSALRFVDAYPRTRRTTMRALWLGGTGLVVGLLVWFGHVRAIQTAYRVPEHAEMTRDFAQHVGEATAPLPGAPPRLPPPPRKDQH